MPYQVGDSLIVIVREKADSISCQVMTRIVQIESAAEMLYGKGWRQILVAPADGPPIAFIAPVDHFVETLHCQEFSYLNDANEALIKLLNNMAEKSLWMFRAEQ